MRGCKMPPTKVKVVLSPTTLNARIDQARLEAKPQLAWSILYR